MAQQEASMPSDRLSRASRALVVAGVLVAILLLGVADYLTGSELAFSVFYLFPVGIAAWYVGRNTGAVMSLLSALSWYLADTLARTEAYSRAFIPAWNTGVRLVTFLSMTTLLAILHEMLERESSHARTDPVTGAANARAFYEAAEVEISKLKRYGRPFTMLYLDVDDLKRINDANGHAAGDRALAASVSTLRRSVRAGDTVARLGGDEFAVLLAEADQAVANIASQRLQSALRQNVGKQEHVTYSIGVITCLAAPRSVDELVERADTLMYEAKRDGKDATRLGVYEGAA
jgi:diguanylate cyclase (GGDEF)-like protein